MYRQWRPGITVDYLADGTAHVAVCFDAARFVAHGADLVSELGVHRFSLSQAGAHMAALVAMPAFQQATSLALYEVGDEGARILGAAAMPRLRDLTVTRGGLTPDGVAALVSGEWPGALVSLTIDQQDVGGTGATALATAGFDQLTTLSLRGCAFGDNGITALAGSISFGALRKLDFTGEPASVAGWRESISDDSVRALAAAPWLPLVEILSLPNRVICSAGALALADMPAPGPIDLDLCHNALDEQAVRALVGVRWTRLARLGLTGNLLWSDHEVDFNDWDGSTIGRGKDQLHARAIDERFGFAARGVQVY